MAKKPNSARDLAAKYGIEGYAKGGAKKPTDIELAVQKVTGMKPGLDRASILPFYTDKSGRNHPSAPQFLYDAAKAFVVPGVAAQGGKYDMGDVVNMAMNVTGGGLGASHVAGPTVRAGEHVLGMGVKPKAAVKEVEKLAARYGLPEFTTDLTPAQIEANRAAHMAGAKSPPVLYHGTTSGNIETFRDRSRGPKLMDGLGAHFGTVDAAQDRLTQNVGRDAEGANILPVHANIQNPPLKKDGSYMTEGELQSFLSRIASGIGIPKSEHRGMAVYGGVKPPVYAKLKDELKARGYDGLAYVNSHEGRGSTSWVAFDPARQVKSTLNRGTFDPKEPHLNKAHGGLIAKYGV